MVGERRLVTGERVALALGVLVFVGFSLGAYLLLLRGDDSPPAGRSSGSLRGHGGLVVTYWPACEDGRRRWSRSPSSIE